MDTALKLYNQYYENGSVKFESFPMLLVLLLLIIQYI